MTDFANMPKGLEAKRSAKVNLQRTRQTPFSVTEAHGVEQTHEIKQTVDIKQTASLKQISDVSFWTDKELEEFFLTLERDEEKEIFQKQLLIYNAQLLEEISELVKDIKKTKYIKNLAVNAAKINQSGDIIEYLDSLLH
ncbi:hypothetical protein CDIK_0989 [Cucumispora dikerogammari]|nr:hypothetical protein CDIK_0989 [Cucumispora dikerogammari]